MTRCQTPFSGTGPCQENTDYLNGSRFRFEEDSTPVKGEVTGQAPLFPEAASAQGG